MNPRLYRKLLEKLEPDIREAFEQAVQNMRSDVDFRRLVEAIEASDTRAIIETLNLDPAQFNGLEEALRNTIKEGGTEEIAGQRNLVRNIAMYFSIGSPRAAAIAQQQSSRLITEIQEEVRESIRDRVAIGINNGENPHVTATNIVGVTNPHTGRIEGGIIGLTSLQQRSVSLAEAELRRLSSVYFRRKRRDRRFDRMIEAAIRAGTPLTAAQIEKITRRYKSRLLKLRGETIARTESIAALNAGRMEATQQLIDAGKIDAKYVTKKWKTSLDPRVRDLHRPMEDQEQRFQDPFLAPNGDQLQYPGDISLAPDASNIINCRCYCEIKINWIERARQRRRERERAG